MKRRRLLSREGRDLRQAMFDTVDVLEATKRRLEEFARLIEEIEDDDVDGS